MRAVARLLINARVAGYTDGTRIHQRSTAPDSLAVFLCLQFGTPALVFCTGRVERRNTIPHCGNRPGATDVALVETRPPATNWCLKHTKIHQEAVMPNSPSFIEAQDAISRHSQQLYALLSTLSSSDALEGLPPAMLANLMWLALELLQQLIEAQGVTEAVAMEGEL